MESPLEIVQYYIDRNYRICYWPPIDDLKGPTTPDWPNKPYPIEGFKEGYRVGLLTGVEISPGRFLHDIDLDWVAGNLLAQQFLPSTAFVFGRTSKTVSHCFYTSNEPIPTKKYTDIKGSGESITFIELRGVTSEGKIGFQTMVPPSIWAKGDLREQLRFRESDGPKFYTREVIERAVLLAAIAMILSKHLGVYGFGHDARLAWAGFLLRAGIEVEELIHMGERMSLYYCENREIADVRRVVESTADALKKQKKNVVGGPALAKIIGENGKAVIAMINSWLGREQQELGDFVRGSNGQVIAKSHANIIQALRILGHELTYDEFAEQRLLDKHPLEDAQVNRLYFTIEHDFHFQPPMDYFRQVLEDISYQNRFHPVRQYLDSLTWDGEARLDMWLVTSAGVQPSDYVKAISSIMLIAAVRRIREPGCKYDEMVVWESQQGLNKSSAAQALCPNPRWFSDDLRLNLHAKELIEATLGKWIIEASDLAGKRKAEIDQLKATLSRQRDGPARMAYAHFPVVRPRHFIIIGTTNARDYLTDSTGGRRFWPVEVKRFNVTWIVENRDQLWAEAAVREANGESIRLPEELWPAAAVEQEERQEIDPWEPIILNYLAGAIDYDEQLYKDPRNLVRSKKGYYRVVTEELWKVLGSTAEKRERRHQNRISEVMQRLGFKRDRLWVPRDDGRVVQQRGYVCVDDKELEKLEAILRSGEQNLLHEEKDDVPF